MSKFPLLILASLLVVGCEPAEEVSVLPLPPLERLSPEARLGIPEISGTWRFAGWEVVRGDTMALERTFPSFGELNIQIQRLDSIAGTFDVGGRPTPVVGEVRRDGWVALATMNGTVPTGFVTGQLGADTLWLELTSVMPPDEWPRDARAAFVQGATGTPIAWLRGTIPGQPTLPGLDSLGLGTDSLQLPGTGISTPTTPALSAPPGGTTAPQTRPPEGAAGNGQQPPRTAPAPAPRTEPIRQTAPPTAPAPAPPPALAPPPSPPPTDPEPEPIPEPEPEQQGPPLLGVPIE